MWDILPGGIAFGVQSRFYLKAFTSTTYPHLREKYAPKQWNLQMSATDSWMIQNERTIGIHRTY